MALDLSRVAEFEQVVGNDPVGKALAKLHEYLRSITDIDDQERLIVVLAAHGFIWPPDVVPLLKELRDGWIARYAASKNDRVTPES